MKAIELTTVSWVQEKSELVTREDRARRYSAAKKNRKENINEILGGIIMATFMVCIFFIGMCV